MILLLLALLFSTSSASRSCLGLTSTHQTCSLMNRHIPLFSHLRPFYTSIICFTNILLLPQSLRLGRKHALSSLSVKWPQGFIGYETEYHEKTETFLKLNPAELAGEHAAEGKWLFACVKTEGSRPGQWQGGDLMECEVVCRLRRRSGYFK